MPKYYVTLEEIVRYEVEVEAENEDDAQADAIEMWCQSPQPDNDFGGSGQGVEAVHVEMAGLAAANAEPMEGANDGR